MIFRTFIKSKIFRISKDLNNTHTCRVGLLLNDIAANDWLIGWKLINNKIITAKLLTQHTKVIIIQAYAPTDVLNKE